MIKVSTLDKVLIGVMLLLAVACVVLVVIQPNLGEQLLTLRALHYWLSRIGLAVALAMLGAAVYIGLVKHGDVNVLFRSATYMMVAFMLIEALVGLAMYTLIGVRPYDEVHLIYGMGAVLSLPFFIYVEVTARKRPAMGSYIWGFTILAAIIVRLYMTGAAG
jgi:predicted neutral ceramidase superfamily lipid hydrolase